MTLSRPLVMQAGGGDATFAYSAQEERAAATAFTAQEGVLWGLVVSQRAAGANFSVDISAGQALVNGDDVSGQGTYVITSNAVENRSIPAAPVSGSRIHRVIAQVEDRLHEGTWADYKWDLIVQEDTGGGTPALPDSAIELALVTVTSTTTSITSAEITPSFTRAQLRSGLLESVAAAAGRPTNPVERQTVWRSDLKDFETFNGTSWQLHGLSRPFAQLTRSTNFGIGNSSVTAFPWNAEDSDTHGCHSTVTNTTRITAQVAGVYEFDCSIPWVPDTGIREMNLRRTTTGAVVTTFTGSRFGNSSAVTAINTTTRKIPLAVGDYVEVVLWQNSGGTLDVDQSYANGPRLDVTWIRPLP